MRARGANGVVVESPSNNIINVIITTATELTFERFGSVSATSPLSPIFISIFFYPCNGSESGGAALFSPCYTCRFWNSQRKSDLLKSQSRGQCPLLVPATSAERQAAQSGAPLPEGKSSSSTDILKMGHIPISWANLCIFADTSVKVARYLYLLYAFLLWWWVPGFDQSLEGETMYINYISATSLFFWGGGWCTVIFGNLSSKIVQQIFVSVKTTFGR